MVELTAGDGAIVNFVGLTRPSGKEGAPLSGLHLDHHPTLTEQSLQEIARSAIERFEVSVISIVHRCGRVAPMEPIVFAAAGARHRRTAFEAVDYLMDRLKTDAVFWKREEGADGSTWIAPTAADEADRARWDVLMHGIDESRTFHPLRVAVMTISDTRTEETDTSGALLVGRLTAAGHKLAGDVIVKDDVEAIREQVTRWVEDPRVDVILTTGGTGFAPRDVTPEAIRPLFRREMDGFSILFHLASLQTVGVSTLQSRAFAGQIGDTFIFCMPGSNGACRDGWDGILALELDSRCRPCSLAGQIPRLREVCA